MDSALAAEEDRRRQAHQAQAKQQRQRRIIAGLGQGFLHAQFEHGAVGVQHAALAVGAAEVEIAVVLHQRIFDGVLGAVCARLCCFVLK